MPTSKGAPEELDEADETGVTLRQRREAAERTGHCVRCLGEGYLDLQLPGVEAKCAACGGTGMDMRDPNAGRLWADDLEELDADEAEALGWWPKDERAVGMAAGDIEARFSFPTGRIGPRGELTPQPPLNDSDEEDDPPDDDDSDDEPSLSDIMQRYWGLEPAENDAPDAPASDDAAGAVENVGPEMPSHHSFGWADMAARGWVTGWTDDGRAGDAGLSGDDAGASDDAGDSDSGDDGGVDGGSSGEADGGESDGESGGADGDSGGGDSSA